jgi:hypothetical protein
MLRIARAISEAEEKAGEVARYFQARPANAGQKHPDVKKIAFCACGAYSGLAALTKARSAAKTQSRDVAARINDTGFGHDTKNTAANPTERNISRKEATSFPETKDMPSLVGGRWLKYESNFI